MQVTSWKDYSSQLQWSLFLHVFHDFTHRPFHTHDWVCFIQMCMHYLQAMDLVEASKD